MLKDVPHDIVLKTLKVLCACVPHWPPCCRSSASSSRLPLRLDSATGVLPLQLRAFTSAPCAKRTLAALGLLFRVCVCVCVYVHTQMVQPRQLMQQRAAEGSQRPGGGGGAAGAAGKKKAKQRNSKRERETCTEKDHLQTRPGAAAYIFQSRAHSRRRRAPRGPWKPRSC